jgi:CRISPR-associated endonuclease/helicase Cas3
MEALIQRFGRVNRRMLKDKAPVNVFCRPDDGQKIYSPDLVNASLRILKQNDGKRINEAEISHWLDEIYKDEIAERWNLEYEQYYQDFERSCIDTIRAFDSNPDLEKSFYQAFDGIEVLPACLKERYYSGLSVNPLDVVNFWFQFVGGNFYSYKTKSS